MKARPTPHQVLQSMAELVATRATCPRLQVGAVLSHQTRVVATGYNGAPAGMPHCTHPLDEPCTDATHAEANLIAFCARHGIKAEGGHLTLTHAPCAACARLIINAGIATLHFARRYRSSDGLRLLTLAGVEWSEVAS